MNSRGVTLIEMLIVILILGMLFAVAFRTIDATTYQSRFDATTKEMAEIIKAFVGNPDLVSDGRRISFGYVGDLGQLPDNFDGLIRPEGTNWKGPYVPRKFIEDTTGFKTDAWGSPYQYDRDNGYIRSVGDGRRILTMKITDSMTDLFNNRIRGTVTDITGAPPVELSSRINMRLTIPKQGNLTDYYIHPGPDGYYEFTPENDKPVPIGNHQLVVKKQYGTQDSIVRWISVIPRSNIIADFRFPTSFRNNLKYVEASGKAWGSDTNNVGFGVFNSGDDLILDSLVVVYLDTTFAFYEEVRWEGALIWDYSSPPPPHRNGRGDIAEFNPKPSIETNQLVRIDINGFKANRTAQPADSINMRGIRIAVKFSDGSIIDFIP